MVIVQHAGYYHLVVLACYTPGAISYGNGYISLNVMDTVIDSSCNICERVDKRKRKYTLCQSSYINGNSLC